MRQSMPVVPLPSGGVERTAMRIGVFTVMTSLLLSAGCASLRPVERGDLSNLLPEGYSDQEIEVRVTRAPKWSESFTDEDLLADLARIRSENKTLKAARARLQQRFADFRVTGSAQRPTLDAETEFERKRERIVDEGTMTASIASLGANLSWELDIWGRLKSLEAAAALAVDEERALLEQLTLSLQLALVENWVSMLTASRLVQVISSQQETNRQLLRLTKLRLEQGQGSALDVLLQKGRLLATERELPAAQAEGQRAWNAYVVLLGQYPSVGNPFQGEFPLPAPIVDLPSPQQLLTRRPDLRAAQFRLLKVDQGVAAAIADQLPRLSIGLGVSASGANVDDIGNGRLLSFTMGLLAPVFDGGRRKAAVAKREAEAVEALADLEQAMLTAVQEIEDSVATERSAYKELRFLQREIGVAQQSVDTARTRYLNGRVSYLTILDSLERLQNLYKREIRLKQSLLSNRARLLAAIGSSAGLDDGA